MQPMHEQLPTNTTVHFEDPLSLGQTCGFAGGMLTDRLFLNCAVFAFQHSLLWNGPVSPSISLFEGQEKRPASLIAADIMTVLSSLLMAVALDCMGRGRGLALAVLSATLGLALFAGSRNMDMLCAGQVFYGVGFTGVRLTVDVLVADSTALHIRTLVYAAMSFPWAITAFSVPVIRQTLTETQLRHALIAFACLVPALGLALTALIRYQSACFDDAKSLSEWKSELWDRERHRFGFPADYVWTLIAVVALFLVLWLVRTDTLPWYAAAPPLVILPIVLLVNGRAHWTRYHRRRVFGRERMLYIVIFGTILNRWNCLRLIFRDAMRPPPRPKTITGRQPLDGLRTNTMYSVCGLCIFWKSTCVVRLFDWRL